MLINDLAGKAHASKVRRELGADSLDQIFEVCKPSCFHLQAVAIKNDILDFSHLLYQ